MHNGEHKYVNNIYKILLVFKAQIIFEYIYVS